MGYKTGRWFIYETWLDFGGQNVWLFKMYRNFCFHLCYELKILKLPWCEVEVNTIFATWGETVGEEGRGRNSALGNYISRVNSKGKQMHELASTRTRFISKRELIMSQNLILRSRTEVYSLRVKNEYWLILTKI